MPKYQAARFLLATLHHESRTMIRTQGDIDCDSLAAILESSLDDLRTREKTICFLAAYLSRCVTGSVPDYATWHPPERWQAPLEPLQHIAPPK